MIDQKLQIAMRRQAERIAEWLNDEAPYAEVDRRHFRINSPERSYFHLGYLQALRRLLQIGQRYSQGARSDDQHYSGSSPNRDAMTEKRSGGHGV
jgi:hypothetical protein